MRHQPVRCLYHQLPRLVLASRGDEPCQGQQPAGPGRCHPGKSTLTKSVKTGNIEGEVVRGRTYTFEPSRERDQVVIREDVDGDIFGAGNPQNGGPHFNDDRKNHYDY